MSKAYIEKFERFLDDEEAVDMFIHGPAGSGKTTLADKLVKVLNERGINFLVCAHTHKACEVLRSKLKCKNIQTLDSYLKRVPVVNQDAKKIQRLSSNAVVGQAEKYDLIIVDEFGAVGEAQHMLLSDKAYDEDGKAILKVVWLGDMNQLKAIGSQSSVIPYGDYEIKLTKVRRTDSAELLRTLSSLVEMIEGTRPIEYLEPHKTFVRDQDIVKLYKETKTKSKCLLAYTNWQVQHLNAEVQGYDKPLIGDLVQCGTDRCEYIYLGDEPWDAVDEIYTGFSTVDRTDKYRTLDFLQKEKYSIGLFRDVETSEELYMAYIFGYGEYNEHKKTLSLAAAEANNKIPSKNPASWAKANKDSPLAKTRAKAWRRFLAFNSCITVIDFPHAFTVHKSQGSTFDEVYLDMDDISRVLDKDTYIRLVYVGISRASKIVYTN